ncbi:MAG: SLBB domain-containing protein, partial [Acidimicrobiales bacterium]
MVDLHSERARIRGLLVNSGRYSFDEADSCLVTSEIAIEVSLDAAATRAGQAALLTAVVTAARCFGVVRVCGALAHPSCFRLPGSPTTLGDAVTRLGGVVDSRGARRSVMIGRCGHGSTGWGVQAFWNG